MRTGHRPPPLGTSHGAVPKRMTMDGTGFRNGHIEVLADRLAQQPVHTARHQWNAGWSVYSQTLSQAQIRSPCR